MTASGIGQGATGFAERAARKRILNAERRALVNRLAHAEATRDAAAVRVEQVIAEILLIDADLADLEARR